MSYLIDCRKNWALPESLLESETDPIRRRNLETIIAHAKAEAKPDFEALMNTVAGNASYTSYTPGGGDENSPTGKEGVANYYKGIVGSGCNHIEHAIERMAVDRKVITTEGDMKMAYPGAVLTDGNRRPGRERALPLSIPADHHLGLRRERTRHLRR